MVGNICEEFRRDSFLRIIQVSKVTRFHATEMHYCLLLTLFSFHIPQDSIAAIQALSFYSREKHFVKVDLSCNVSFDRQNEYSHSFKFTEKNAIQPELLSNVSFCYKCCVLLK